MERTDTALYNIHQIQENCKKNTKNSAWSRKLTPAQRLAKLNKQFSKLNLENYLRKYTDRSEECNYKLPSTEELNQIYDEMEKLNVLELPVLVGISRKSMIYKLLGGDATTSLNGTTVLDTIALMKGASILRVHDVKEAAEAVKIVEAMKEGRV